MVLSQPKDLATLPTVGMRVPLTCIVRIASTKEQDLAGLASTVRPQNRYRNNITQFEPSPSAHDSKRYTLREG